MVDTDNGVTTTKKAEKLVSQQVKKFVPSRELTTELAMLLPKMNVILRDFKTKKGFHRYTIEFTIVPRFITPEIILIKADFFNLLMDLKKPLYDEASKREITKWVVPVFYRFVEGMKTDGTTYRSVELIFNHDHYHRYFFNNDNKTVGNELDSLERIEKQGKLFQMNNSGRLALQTDDLTAPVVWYWQDEKISETLNAVFEE